MLKPRPNTSFLPLDDTLFAVKQRKPFPYEFVLDVIAPLSPETRSMFGCLAVYVDRARQGRVRTFRQGILRLPMKLGNTVMSA
jgi:hypothetical protein